MKGIKYSLCVGFSAAAAALILSATPVGAITVDGTLDGAYGSPITVQTIDTGFGDSSYSAGPNSPDANGSELDAGYGLISGGNLYVFIAGNFENNGNKVDVFLADGRAGQSTLSLPATGSMANMNGSKFSPSFSATYALTIGDYQGTAYVEEYDLVANTGGYVGSFSLGPNGGIGSGSPGGSIVYGWNNSNTGGVGGSAGNPANQAAAAAVTTGLEIQIPLSLLGNPSGSIKVLADQNGGNNDYMSNQLLPGLPAGTQNLGGGGPYAGAQGQFGYQGFDFSNLDGEYFTIVPEPSTIALVCVGLLGLLTVRSRKS